MFRLGEADSEGEARTGQATPRLGEAEAEDEAEARRCEGGENEARRSEA